jgi:hypothetical protein
VGSNLVSSWIIDGIGIKHMPESYLFRKEGKMNVAKLGT